MKIILDTIFTFYLLLLPISVLSHVAEPFDDESLPEARLLNGLYHSPMVSINRLLGKAEIHCSRMPSEKEFNDFILKGGHEYIRCSEKIKAAIPSQGIGYQVGKNLPHLPEFLRRKQYQVYSDTKTIFVILKQKTSEWKYTHFKSEEYEFVIHCTFGMKRCSLNSIEDMAKSCRASKTSAKNNCYFGDKKVIDY